MRAIDADFVQDALTKTITEILSKSQNESTQYVAMGLASIKTIIDIAPTLDVAPAVEAEPVRHGRWEKGGYACGETEWKCSVCGETEWRTSCSRMKFCMFCGAKMDAGQEDDENA